MGQVRLNVDVIEINGINERMFVEFFDIDSDFSENEEYFREDTLELGFKSESERCSKEMYEELVKHFSNEDGDMEIVDDNHFIEGITEILDKCVEEYSDFILGNNTYTKEYEITPIFNDGELGIDYDGKTTVIISYISR